MKSESDSPIFGFRSPHRWRGSTWPARVVRQTDSSLSWSFPALEYSSSTAGRAAGPAVSHKSFNFSVNVFPQKRKEMSVPAYNEEERNNRKPIKQPLKAIRAHCLECVGGSVVEVELCTAPACQLYPFRSGRNPFRKPPSERQREASRRNARRCLDTVKGTSKIPSDVN